MQSFTEVRSTQLDGSVMIFFLNIALLLLEEGHAFLLLLLDEV